MDTFKKFTSIHDSLVIEMNKCLRPNHTVYRIYHGKLGSRTDIWWKQLNRGENPERALPGKCVITITIVTLYPTETMEVVWLLFELTVTWLEWHLVALTKSPDQGGEEGRSQMIGWGPKTEVAPFSLSAKTTRRNVSYWKGLVADRPIAIYSG